MRDEPSEELLRLFERLRLATPEQVAAVAGRARRLARGLPLFESVWVDALAQARVLSPFQSLQINTGRGESLQVADYVLVQPLRSPPYARVYRARHIASGRDVRLLVASIQQRDQPAIERQLDALVQDLSQLDGGSLVPIETFGIDGQGARRRLWCASDVVAGVTAAEWLIPHGRMPHEAALEVARQMATALALLERSGPPHGDISASQVVITDNGDVRLPMPGLRAVLRPEEGYGHADLAPEAYDYVAPERIADGTPPATASELYACGCLWWHLLTGRPPVPGGDSLAKLRNVQKGAIPDVRRLAPETPGFFAEAIAQCTSANPAARGTSMAALSEWLAAPTRQGSNELVWCLGRHDRPRPMAIVEPWRGLRHSSPATRAAWAAAVLVVILLGGLWFRGRRTVTVPTASLKRPATSVQADADNATAATDTPLPAPAAVPVDSAAAPMELVDLNVAQVSHTLASAGRLPRLQPGMTVRGDASDRPIVYVPREGLLIDQPHVRLENLDFVWADAGTADDSGQPAMIRLHSHWIEFHRCTFQSAELEFGAAQPVAVAWEAASNEPGAARPAAVRIHLDQCVLRGVAAAIDLRSANAVTVESVGTLYLGPGPLLKLPYCPKLNQPVVMALERVTMRGATALVLCQYDSIWPQPGKISITAENSVFEPQVDGALLVCEGEDNPQPLLRFAQWSGQGSLLARQRKFAVWKSPTGDTEPVDVEHLLIDGLTRSQFEFDGPQIEIPASSRLRDWVAPLRGSQPPGISDSPLNLPNVALRRASANTRSVRTARP